jgi:Na+-translocating ferredoxin:NAD+ oxidoreductase RnfD subunit
MITAPTRARPSPARAVVRFFRSPKGYLLLILALLAAMAAPTEGIDRALPSLVGAAAVAALIDLIGVRWTRRAWIFPSGAILTGLIVAMVLSPAEPLAVPLVTSAVAVLSKYVARTRWSNVFNPAAVALIVAYFAFGGEQSWWGALPNLPVPAVVVLLATGIFMVDRVNKLPMVLVFLGGYFLLFTASALLGDPARVAEIFRSPDANAALFFALFMLDDPPTSPARYGDQVIYGLIVAVVSFAVFQTSGAVYYLLAGVLVGNAWESLRRWEELSRPRTA